MAKTKMARYNRVSVFDIVLTVIMILFMATIILPFIHVIAVSFSSNGAVMAGKVSLWPVEPTLSTYEKILGDGKFITAYGNTIWVTLVGTALSLTVSAMAAYALSRRKLVGHSLFTWMITITMFFGGGLIPTYLAVSSYGLINSRWAMILPGLVSTWNMIILRSFFAAYPKEIIESGQIDGLQEAGVFFRLVLPTSKAALATIGLYYAVGYWNTYMSARLYIRDIEKYPVMHLLRTMLSSANNLEDDASNRLVEQSVRYSSLVVTVLPIMCVYPWLQKYFVKGVMVGSVKG